MSRISAEVWTRLAGERIQGELLWARRAAPEITEALLAALDADEHRHFLALLRPEDPDFHDAQSRGIEVVTRKLAVRGHQVGRYFDLICRDHSGHEAFDLIGWEIAQRLATSGESAPEVVTRVLAKWRRFWGLVPRDLLAREEQLGLFAELWFLSIWLIPKIGGAQAVQRWRGPFRSRHDFEWPGSSVEVKATLSTRGPIHRINGLDQLAPPDKGMLLFFSLRLREEAGSMNTLPAVIATCNAQLESDPQALGAFEAALVLAGYSPAHEEEYTSLRLRVVEEGLFEVREDFPRMAIGHRNLDVPPGVERVEYEINLSGFSHLCIARNAVDCPAF